MAAAAAGVVVFAASVCCSRCRCCLVSLLPLLHQWLPLLLLLLWLSWLQMLLLLPLLQLCLIHFFPHVLMKNGKMPVKHIADQGGLKQGVAQGALGASTGQISPPQYLAFQLNASTTVRSSSSVSWAGSGWQWVWPKLDI